MNYLERCSRLLEVATDNGVSAKLNILLSPGETKETIDETTEWLESHRPYFVGVSIYPTAYYGLSPTNDPLIESYKSLGATLSDNSPAEGVHHMNLSKTIPYPDSEIIARELARRFMTDAQYFKLKSFSYFDPGYSEEEFNADVQQSAPDALPFKVTAESLGL